MEIAIPTRLRNRAPQKPQPHGPTRHAIPTRLRNRAPQEPQPHGPTRRANPTRRNTNAVVPSSSLDARLDVAGRSQSIVLSVGRAGAGARSAALGPARKVPLPPFAGV